MLCGPVPINPRTGAGPRPGVRDHCFTEHTFHEERQRQSEAIHTQRRQLKSFRDNQGNSRNPEEQIHGAVLPVHQLDPGVVLRIIEVSDWSAWVKLFNQDACDRITSDKSHEQVQEVKTEKVTISRKTHPQTTQTPEFPPQCTPSFAGRGRRCACLWSELFYSCVGECVSPPAKSRRRGKRSLEGRGLQNWP